MGAADTTLQLQNASGTAHDKHLASPFYSYTSNVSPNYKKPRDVADAITTHQEAARGSFCFRT